jgi:hypothetical protein
VTHGDKIIQFLKFLSEFCLRQEIENKFPTAKVPFIRINISKNKETDFKDINELYAVSSFLDPRTSLLKLVSPEKIQDLISSCFWLIKTQQEKFHKRASRLFGVYDKWKKESDTITAQYLQNKDSLISAHNRQKQIEKTLDKRYFTELRALDRVPQIDMIDEVYKILKRIHVHVSMNRLENMINDFNAKIHRNTLS